MIEVRATAPGYYGLIYRREGDVFEVESEAALSAAWMERTDGETIAPRDYVPEPSAPRVAGPVAAPGVKIIGQSKKIKADKPKGTGDQSVI